MKGTIMVLVLRDWVATPQEAIEAAQRVRLWRKMQFKSRPKKAESPQPAVEPPPPSPPPPPERRQVFVAKVEYSEQKLGFVSKVLSAHHGPAAEIRHLKSQRRTKALVHARQEAAWLLRETTGWSLPKIGARLGGRDHTTILHALRAVADRRKRSPEMTERLDGTREQLRAEFEKPR